MSFFLSFRRIKWFHKIQFGFGGVAFLFLLSACTFEASTSSLKSTSQPASNPEEPGTTQPTIVLRNISVSLESPTEVTDNKSSISLSIEGVILGDQIKVYSDNQCTTEISDIVTSIGLSASIPITLNQNTTFDFYIIITDTEGGHTECLPSNVTYKKVRGITVSTTSSPNSSDSNTSDGSCNNGSGECSLRAAFDEAFASTEEVIVDIPAGIFLFTSRISKSVSSLTVPVTFRGKIGTIFDGQGSVPILRLSGTYITSTNASVALNTIHFQNGHNDIEGYGGAVQLWAAGASSNLTILKNAIFTNNYATVQGGALNASGSWTMVEDVEFSGNSLDVNGTYGHALLAGGTNNSFKNIYIHNHSVSTTWVEGVLAVNTGGTLNFENISLVNNSTDDGAMYFYNCADCTIKNSTVSNNNGRNNIGISGTRVFKIYNSTFFDNFLDQPANSQRNLNFSGGPTNSLTIKNSIFALTDLSGKSMDLSSYTGTKDISNVIINDSSHGISSGVVVANPLLDILGDNGGLGLTHSLQTGSPAIDTGDPVTCATTDERNLPRPVDKLGGGAICDIGALELQ